MKVEILKTKVFTDVYYLKGILDDIGIVDALRKEVINNLDPKMKNITNVYGEMTDFKFFCNHPLFHSFLKLIEKEVKYVAGNIEEFNIIDAWGNKYSHGGYADLHDHRRSSGFCGILYTDDEGPGTLFPELNIHEEDKRGKFVLFSPCLLHSVPKHLGQKDRVTLAFNCNTIEKWDSKI
jgi:hypothetical protein